MRWAIISSLILHGIFIGLVFKNTDAGSRAYPKIIPVHLTSLPVSKGIEKPAVAAEAPSKPSKQQKIEEPKDKPRITEVDKRKRPARKKAPETKPAVQEDKTTNNGEENKNKGLPDGVDLGSEFGSARLDASGFDSPYFLNVLFSKIRNNWDNPYEGADSVGCVIYFVVDRKGRIVDSAIERSSGLAVYDQSALRAVLAAKPPPLPNQFGSEELGIHLEFKYLPYN